MSKRKAESDCKREFNEEWENDFLFIANPAGKPLCIVCETTLSYKNIILIDTIKHNTRLQLKMKRSSGLVLSYIKNMLPRRRKKSEDDKKSLVR